MLYSSDISGPVFISASDSILRRRSGGPARLSSLDDIVCDREDTPLPIDLVDPLPVLARNDFAQRETDDAFDEACRHLGVQRRHV